MGIGKSLPAPNRSSQMMVGIYQQPAICHQNDLVVLCFSGY